MFHFNISLFFVKFRVCWGKESKILNSQIYICDFPVDLQYS